MDPQGEARPVNSFLLAVMINLYVLGGGDHDRILAGSVLCRSQWL